MKTIDKTRVQLELEVRTKQAALNLIDAVTADHAEYAIAVFTEAVRVLASFEKATSPSLCKLTAAERREIARSNRKITP